MKHREKQSIIIWFFSALFIFISFLVISFIYVYPNILDIENNKKLLIEKINKYKIFNEKWVDFNGFKNLIWHYSNTDDKTLNELLDSWYFKKSLKNIDENFYNHAVYNWDYDSFNSEKNILDYLDDNLKWLDWIKKSDSFNKKIWKLSSVLPTYSNYIELDSSKSLTDLKFISYIEKLLNSFYLKTTSSIWIKDILAVENKMINKEDNIYYIPLDLELTWTKINILKFLDYIKNTWNVDFKENDFSFKNNKWATDQLSEVDSFNIKEYIDNSYIQRTLSDSSLETFLSDTKQDNDIIKANISLKFYINSIWKDKIIDKINSIIWDNTKEIIVDDNWNYIKDPETWEYEYFLIKYNFNNLLNNVKRLKSNTKLAKNNYYKTKVSDIFMYLNNKDLKKDFSTIKKEISKTKDLNTIYKKVIKYKNIFTKLDKEIYNIVESLWLQALDKVNENGKIIKKWFYPKGYIVE